MIGESLFNATKIRGGETTTNPDNF